MLPQLLHQAHGLHFGSIARTLLHASAIIALWRRRVDDAALADGRPYRDPTAAFDAHDWADLPPHHPREPEA